MNASQRIYVVGKVLTAKREVVEAKEVDGVIKKGKTAYNLFVKLPNGTTLSIRKNIWDSEKEPVKYVIDATNKLEEIIEKVNNNETVLISKFISANDEGKMFDWFTSYTNSKDKTSYQLEGFVNIQDFTEDDNGNITVHFKKSDKAFEDCAPTFEATMYIEDVIDNKIILTDGEDNYPNELTVELAKTPKTQPTVGQGYKFTLELVRGDVVKKEDTMEELDFEEEAKTEYPDDKLIVKKVGKVTDMVLEGLAGSTEVDF